MSCGCREEVWSGGRSEKRQMLKWFGHMEQMEEGKMTRRVNMSEIEGGNVRERPPLKWRNRVQDYLRERGEGSLRNLEQARRVCQDRERWKGKKKKNVLSQNVFFLGQLFLFK